MDFAPLAQGIHLVSHVYPNQGTTMKKYIFMGLLSVGLFSFQAQAQAQDAGCCCTDCTCPPGAPGPAGSQGTQGVSGLEGPQGIQGNTGPLGSPGSQGSQGTQGTPGLQGPQGIQGSTGSQGTQGNTGAQGPCCPPSGTFLSLYSNLDQLLAPNADGTFEQISSITASFDISNAATTGAITVLKSGVYLVNWEVDAIEDVFSFPVTSWSFALTQNGTPVLSTVSGSTSTSPDDLVTLSSANAIITITAGDVITLRNTSINSVNLVSSAFGSTVPLASCRINFTLLTAL